MRSRWWRASANLRVLLKSWMKVKPWLQQASLETQPLPPKKGVVERKKTKTSDQELSPSMAKTIADAEAISRLVNKNLRGAEGSASSSAGQQLG